MWCDSDYLAEANNSDYMRRKLQQSLKCLKTNENVHALAMSRLSASCKELLAAADKETKKKRRSMANAAQKTLYVAAFLLRPPAAVAASRSSWALQGPQGALARARRLWPPDAQACIQPKTAAPRR